jgi:Cu(I)/Ag(I) efflux system membrane fusion protein
MKRPAPTTKWILLFAAVFFLGWFAGRRESGESGGHSGHSKAAAGETVWTCSMHPNIRLPEPGQCPICSMDLIPLEQEERDAAASVPADGLKLSENAAKLADIQTSRVERRAVENRIRLYGKIDYDETRVKVVTSRIKGRLDRLFIDYTGMRVHKGDHLAMIYSPDLLTAQEELLEARRRMNNPSGGESDFLKESNRRALESAREKLRLWDIPAGEIRAVEERGELKEHLLLNAPLEGVVIHKAVREGQYVQTGDRIFTIADLARLWVVLEAYETDLPWLRYGQRVRFETEAHPGVTFTGRISFIDRVLDPEKRVAGVRVNVDNADGRLKPGMYVTATVRSKVAAGGDVMDPSLAGKWICPMHPEIQKDESGVCDICGMALDRPEELGYRTPDVSGPEPLVVPASAVLQTGRRAVVYVRDPESEVPVFTGSTVVLGPRAGDVFVVLSGLEEGERVATRGSFKIDSEMQIRAKPGMMSLPAERGSIDLSFFEPLMENYLKVHGALAADDASAAKRHWKNAARAAAFLAEEDPGGAAEFFQELERTLRLPENGGLENLRGRFARLSEKMKQLVDRFGIPGTHELSLVHCPMAFGGEGADWLQEADEVTNPYFGKKMLRCGTQTTRYLPTGKE